MKRSGSPTRKWEGGEMGKVTPTVGWRDKWGDSAGQFRGRGRGLGDMGKEWSYKERRKGGIIAEGKREGENYERKGRKRS